MISRRHLLATAAAGLAGSSRVHASAEPTTPSIPLRFSDVTLEDAPRSRALVRIFVPELGPGFVFQPYFGGAIFRQGTELAAVQRGHLEMALVPPSDFAKHVPAFDLLGAAYMVRDSGHLDRVFAGEVGEAFRSLARQELGVVVLAPAYYGTRHLNLRGTEPVGTPEDLKGVRLRMPPGESWQRLGRALGADPVPLAYAETYTALKLALVDGQDNPLPNTYRMGFHEVTRQVVLTGHSVGFDLLVVRAPLFDSLTPDQQERMRRAAERAFTWSTAEYLRQEQALVTVLAAAGLRVYEPDIEAFRRYATLAHQQSPFRDFWIPGLVDQIRTLI
ncbi:MAG TPA: TRAP transporter substrate-binding protein DctP [Microvirga sp.]|jgi:TRAP-type C4-dicarboxylate transport system substrate-binding protein|nr:TRAP transporter substrate-binding protein DctP [Microvirga sp.]